MGLADRNYMRQASGGRYWSATIMLLLINATVFVLQSTVLPARFTWEYLGLSIEGLQRGFVWQFLTFQFLHGHFWHILGNSLVIFFFGRPVEILLGRSRFLQLYLASGVLGGLLQMLLALSLPQFFSGAVVGASAGGAGLIAAFAVMHWNERFTMFFYFIPLNIRGRTLFWGSVILAALGLLNPHSVVAHAAHLGGILGGFAFVHWNLGLRLAPWRFGSGRRRREPVKAVSIKGPRWPSPGPANPPDVPSEEFISREVDPILDKISEHGIQSLTERERRILEAARARMAKR